MSNWALGLLQSEKGKAAARRYYEKRKLRLKALKAVQTVTKDKPKVEKQKEDKTKKNNTKS